MAPGSPRKKLPFLDQFSHPSGRLSQLAGCLVADTAEGDLWIVDLLDLQPDHRGLEVDFGPGVALAMIAARVHAGEEAREDPLDVMLHQATRRNRAAVQEGWGELRLANPPAGQRVPPLAAPSGAGSRK